MDEATVMDTMPAGTVAGDVNLLSPTAIQDQPDEQAPTPPQIDFTGDTKTTPAIPAGSLPPGPPELPPPAAPVDFNGPKPPPPSAVEDLNPTPPPPPEQPAPVSSARAARIAASPVGGIIAEAAKRLGYPADKIMAVVSVESSGNPDAHTPRSAAHPDGKYRGLGQLSAEEFAKYGNGGNILDPRANIEATIRSLQDKEAKFKADFGREPSATELYLAHQQGEGGLRAHLAHPDWPAYQSMYSTAEGRQKGEAWARAAIWGNVPQDVRAQYGNDVSNITSRDFINIWSNKLTGGSIPRAGNVDFTPTVNPADINAPAPGPTEGQKQAARMSQLHADAEAPAYQPLTDVLSQSSLTYRAAAALGNDFAPDMDFRLTPDIQNQLMKEHGLPEDSRAALGGAVSLQNAQYLAQREQDSLAQQQRIQSYGLPGTLAELAVGIMDPSAIAAAVATSGMADIVLAGSAASTAARIAGQAVAGGVTGVGLSKAMEMTGDVHAMDDMGLTIAAGMAFGGVYGAVSHNPFTAQEAGSLIKGSKLVKDMIDTQAAATDAGSVGAAANPIVTMPALNEKALIAVQNEHVAYTGMKSFFGLFGIRPDAAGVVKSWDNPIGRILGGIGRDAVGTADGSTNWMSASEAKTRFMRSWNSKFSDVWEPSVKEWAKDQGAKFGPMAEWNYGSKFGDEVSRYVWNRDTTQEFHPAVARTGEKLRSLMEDVLYQAAGADGRYRPVQGFEEIRKDKFYLTRMYDRTKFNAAMNEFGESGVVKAIKGAHMDGMPDLNPEDAEKIAQWHVSRIYSRANGLDDHLNLALSGYDRESLANVFREANVPEDRIAYYLDKAEKSDQPGAAARAKHKLPLNENYSTELPSSKGGTANLSVRDLLVTDAAQIANTYFHQMSGRTALAQWQGKLKDGTTIFNGITSDNEWLAAKNAAIKKGMDMGLTGVKDAKARDGAIQNLDFMYNGIIGKPDADQIGAGADFMRRMGKVDYARVGWNFGLAQIPETLMPIALTTFKSVFSHFPELRRMVNDRTGASEPLSQIMKDWEAMVGRPASRGLQYFQNSESGLHAPGANGKFDNAMTFVNNAVTKASGLHYIDSFQKSVTAKSVLQRFTDLAHEASAGTTGKIDVSLLGEARLRRMRDLGLSDDMLGRVLGQIRDHSTTEAGMFNDNVVRALNFDKWKDAEARSSFELSAQRFSHSIIQENDIGMLHRWMAKPVAQMMMRFRNFAVGAYTSQTLHNIHMRDMDSFHQVWMTSLMGAFTYALQVQLMATGRSDRQQYLDKHLSPSSMVLGAFNKMGASSVLPTLYDSAAYVVGGHPAFTFRTSGQPSDVLFGAPALSFINDIAGLSKGVIQPFVDGRERSQQEYRNITSALGIGRWLPMQMLLSTMVKDKQLMAPKDQKN